MSQPTSQFSGIFISYRREDSSGHAGRLFDHLVNHFGRDRIFMDIDTIEPGEDFVKVIEDAVGSCDILLAIIGQRWLSAGKNTGSLHNPNDFVRIEIATALSRNIRVIPVLVQNAPMPRSRDLPDDLTTFARRNALALDDHRWQHDVEQLVSVMNKILTKRADAQPATPKAIPPQPPPPQIATPKLAEAEQRLRQAAAEQQRTRLEQMRDFGVDEVTCAAAGKETPRPQKQPARTPSDLLHATTPKSTPNTLKRNLIILMAVAAGVIALGVAGLIWVWQRSSQEARRNVATGELAVQKADAGSLVQEAEMVYVPGGEFTMGRKSSDPMEAQTHTVTVKPFSMDVYEVTGGDYEKFLDANADQAVPSGWVNRKCPAGAARKPVTGVDWHQANAYAAWLGKRLPTEEEWEFAARGTDGRVYPWGNDWKAGLANTGKPGAGAAGGGAGMAPVGQYKGASPFGIYDMVGNAWEWTASDAKNGEGRGSSQDSGVELKIIRGGSWASQSEQATTTFRRGYAARDESRGYSYTGFRLVRDVSPAAANR